MQNLDVKDTIQKIKRTKPQIKKEIEESITNHKKIENTDMQEIVNKYIANQEDAIKVVHEHEEILKNKRK